MNYFFKVKSLHSQKIRARSQDRQWQHNLLPQMSGKLDYLVTFRISISAVRLFHRLVTTGVIDLESIAEQSLHSDHVLLYGDRQLS